MIWAQVHLCPPFSFLSVSYVMSLVLAGYLECVCPQHIGALLAGQNGEYAGTWESAEAGTHMDDANSEAETCLTSPQKSSLRIRAR